MQYFFLNFLLQPLIFLKEKEVINGHSWFKITYLSLLLSIYFLKKVIPHKFEFYFVFRDFFCLVVTFSFVLSCYDILFFVVLL